MARTYAKLHTTIWQSRKFRSLAGNNHARLFYLYLHSCNQVNSVGCFRLPLGYATTDTGWDETVVLEAINSLSAANLIEWDSTECFIRIVDFIEHDPPTNPKHGGAMRTIARSLPDGPQKLAVVKDLLAQPHCANDVELRGMHDRLYIPYKEAIAPYPLSLIPNPSSLRSDGGPQASPPSKRKRNVLISLPVDCPTESDRGAALRYWRDRGREDLCATIDDEITAFRAHHAGHGSRMADWSSAWVTWYGKAIKFNRKSSNGTQHGRKPRSSTDQHLAGLASIVDEIRARRET